MHQQTRSYLSSAPKPSKQDDWYHQHTAHSRTSTSMRHGCASVSYSRAEPSPWAAWVAAATVMGAAWGSVGNGGARVLRLLQSPVDAAARGARACCSRAAALCAACAKAMHLRVRRPRVPAWACPNSSFHACNPQLNLGEEQPGGKKTQKPQSHRPSGVSLP